MNKMSYIIIKQIGDFKIKIEYIKNNTLDGGKVNLYLDDLLFDEWYPFNENLDENDNERITCPIIDTIRTSLAEEHPKLSQDFGWYDMDVLNLQSIIDNDWRRILIESYQK